MLIQKLKYFVLLVINTFVNKPNDRKYNCQECKHDM